MKKNLCVLLAFLIALCFVSCAVKTAPTVCESSAENSEGTNESNITVRFINVGQGDAILIAFPNGEFMLIDAGPYTNKDAVLDNLDEYGVKRIKYTVFTHFDADHIGSAAEVIDKYDIENVIMPDATATSKTFDNLLSALEAHDKIKVIKGEAGYKFELEGALFEILSPFDTEGADANETSIVLLMSYKDIRMLFMGDAEKSNEEKIINRYGTAYIKADLIKIGHHGSSTSSSYVFLLAVSPKYAVISCGAGNPYGHPAQETLDTLGRLHTTYYRTDIEGTITAVTDGQTITMFAES